MAVVFILMANTLDASEPGQGARTYICDLNGGNLRAITPEGVIADVVSPDGKWVAGLDSNRIVTLYSIADGSPHAIPHIPAGLYPIQWTPNSASVYVKSASEAPTTISIVDVNSGRTQPFRTLFPPDPAAKLGSIHLTPDGHTYLYNYVLALSELYLVDGLK